MIKKVEVEVIRNNVSLSTFFRAVSVACERKGLGLGIDRNEFESTTVNDDTRYNVKDGIKHYSHNGYRIDMPGDDAACAAEICRIKPLDMQFYVKYFDGTLYNEICEFTFDSKNKGCGYYYQLQALL